eukprot:GFUD01038362.1.p1 GENE.GFUD01038362.1~~GFUD01038362.1.p1  ORF type:complete len:656 (-),score=158.45 GFUD01038362.1:44-2011(-)
MTVERTRKRTMSSSFRERAGSNAKEFFHPNMNLLPLKFTLFFFNGASFAILPYLTIHMKDIGINDVDIALMYAILPFCVFIAPPIVGFFADKLGNYMRALLMSIVGCAIFHTLLLAVPTNLSHVDYPHTTLTMKHTDVELKWAPCAEQACTKIRNPEEKEKDPLPIFFELNNCTLDCPQLNNLMVAQAYLGIAVTYESMICGQIGVKHCKVWPGQRKVEFVRVNTNVSGNDQCGEAQISFFTDSDPCVTNDIKDETILGIKPDCDLSCEVRTNLVERCGDSNSGNRLITNGVYFIFRMMATMCLACCFILLDAQTIQMCAVEEKHGKVGAYGRQILYKTLAQAVISPLVGGLMDYITGQQGQPNYVASFIIADLLFLLSFLCAFKIDMDLELPVNKDAMGGLKAILTNFEILLFLLMMFVCGTMYGFVETFLFVFLKEDLHAPMYLLGLTITTGAVVSLPFLYYSDAIVKKVGCEVVIMVALIMYAVRYVGYSYIYCAWYAFPFEALEVFTFFSLRVGAAKFIAENAPPGMLATLTGLEGGAHNGLGKGFGGLLGGFTIEYTKSTHKAFWLFGIISAIFGVIYTVFVSIFLVRKKRNTRKQNWGKGDGQDSDKEENVIAVGEREGGVGGEETPEKQKFLENPDIISDGLNRDSST